MRASLEDLQEKRRGEEERRVEVEEILAGTREQLALADSRFVCNTLFETWVC